MAKQTAKPETVKTETEVKAEVNKVVETKPTVQAGTVNTEVKSDTPEVKKEDTPEVKPATPETTTNSTVQAGTVNTEVKKEDTPEEIINKTFDKASEETDNKLNEKSKEEETEEEDIKEPTASELESPYKEPTTYSEEEVKTIAEELGLKEGFSFAEYEGKLYYRLTPTPDQTTWSEWILYEPKDTPVALEGIDKQIEKILKEENYFNFSSVGRLIIDGKYDEETLKNFHNEFKTSEILFNKNHYDLLDLLNKKFK